MASGRLVFESSSSAPCSSLLLDPSTPAPRDLLAADAARRARTIYRDTRQPLEQPAIIQVQAPPPPLRFIHLLLQQAPHARRWQARRQHARASTSARARLLPATTPHRCFFVWLQIARAAMHDASCALFHIVCEPAAPHGVCGDKCVDPCRYLSLESSARWLLWTWAKNI